MAVQYAGGTNVNALINATTRTELTDNLKTQLVNAGWSVASGSSGDWKLDSATTANGHNVRVRVWDPGSGNCARTQIMNTAETLTGTIIGYLLPAAAKQFRVIANKYQCFVFYPGSKDARDYVSFGTLYVPSFLTVNIAAWITASGGSDSDTAVNQGWLRQSCTQQNVGYNSHLTHTLSIQTGNNQGHPRMGTMTSGANASGYRWRDGSLLIEDALVWWSSSDSNSVLEVQGIMFDAFFCSDNFAADATVTYDGKTFMAITGSTWTGMGERGTLFVYAP